MRFNKDKTQVFDVKFSQIIVTVLFLKSESEFLKCFAVEFINTVFVCSKQ